MIDLTQDLHPLTKFKRDTSGLLSRMRKTGRPLVLTVKGKPEAVVLEPAVYQQVAEYLDAIAAIQRGLPQAKKGAGRLVDEVFDDLENEPALKR